MKCHYCKREFEVAGMHNMQVLAPNGVGVELVRACASCLSSQPHNNGIFHCECCGILSAKNVRVMDSPMYITSPDARLPQQVCIPCFGSHARCFACGRIVKMDVPGRKGFTRHGAEFYGCKNHDPNSQPKHNPRHGAYNYKKLPVFFITKNQAERLGAEGVTSMAPHASSVPYLGVELEVDRGAMGSWMVSELQDRWGGMLYTKYDGSLGTNGIEIVTHPGTLEWHKRGFPWDEMCDLLNEYEYKGGGTAEHPCGLHVHVSRSFFSSSASSSKGAHVMQLKLAAFVHMHSRELSEFAERTQAKYAKYKDTTESPSSIKALLVDYDKYEAVNFVNDTTIEFRIFSSSINPDRILACLEFVHAVSHFVTKVTMSTISQRKLAWYKFCQFLQSSEKRYARAIGDMGKKGLLVSSVNDIVELW